MLPTGDGVCGRQSIVMLGFVRYHEQRCRSGVGVVLVVCIRIRLEKHRDGHLKQSLADVHRRVIEARWISVWAIVCRVSHSYTEASQ